MKHLQKIAIASHLAGSSVIELRRARTKQLIHTVELPPTYTIGSLSGMGAANMAHLIEQVRMLDISRVLVVNNEEVQLVTPDFATLVARNLRITETDVLEERLLTVVNEVKLKKAIGKTFSISLGNKKVHDRHTIKQHKLRARHSGVATRRTQNKRK